MFNWKRNSTVGISISKFIILNFRVNQINGTGAIANKTIKPAIIKTHSGYVCAFWCVWKWKILMIERTDLMIDLQIEN